jgi:Tfp pilus assembly protein PilX
MNKKLALVLLSSPTVLGSMLSMVLAVNPAHATEAVSSVTDSCWSKPTSHISRLTCARFSHTTQIASTGDRTEVQTASIDQSSSEPPTLDFTEEESDAAVQLFGCDCVVCINAIRQMRGLAPVS